MQTIDRETGINWERVPAHTEIEVVWGDGRVWHSKLRLMAWLKHANKRKFKVYDSNHFVHSYARCKLPVGMQIPDEWKK